MPLPYPRRCGGGVSGQETCCVSRIKLLPYGSAECIDSEPAQVFVEIVEAGRQNEPLDPVSLGSVAQAGHCSISSPIGIACDIEPAQTGRKQSRREVVG